MFGHLIKDQQLAEDTIEAQTERFSEIKLNQLINRVDEAYVAMFLAGEDVKFKNEMRLNSNHEETLFGQRTREYEAAKLVLEHEKDNLNFVKNQKLQMPKPKVQPTQTWTEKLKTKLNQPLPEIKEDLPNENLDKAKKILLDLKKPVPEGNIVVWNNVPMRIFSNSEIAALQERYNAIEPHLKQIMDSGLEDQVIRFVKIKTPVFLRYDGKLIDFEDAVKLIGKPFPFRNKERMITAEDIIPSRTMSDTMELLLTIIKAEKAGIVVPPPDIDVKLAFEIPREEKDSDISDQSIQFIEMHCGQMENKHQWLFASNCRDLYTGKVVRAPKQGLDGYVVDGSTAKFAMETFGACPIDRSIKARNFNEDFSPAPYHQTVINSLCDGIPAMIEKAKKAQLAKQEAVVVRPRI